MVHDFHLRPERHFLQVRMTVLVIIPLTSLLRRTHSDLKMVYVRRSFAPMDIVLPQVAVIKACSVFREYFFVCFALEQRLLLRAV